MATLTTTDVTKHLLIAAGVHPETLTHPDLPASTMGKIAQLAASMKVFSATEGELITFDNEVFKTLLEELEDFEDATELDTFRQNILTSDEELIPWEQAKEELRAAGVEV